MIIQCTNPTCKNAIPVPDGSSYVVCPVCNTWHFPSDFDNAADNSLLGNIDYGLPSEPNAAPAPAPQPPKDSPFPQYQTHDGVGIPSFEPTFHQPEPEREKEKTTIGCVVLPNGSKLQLRVGKNIIGRHDLPNSEPTVSRKHCVIEVSPAADGKGWIYLLYDIGVVEGKGSLNKVYIFGRSLPLGMSERIQIYNGTVFSLGNVKLTLHSPV